MPSLVSPSYPPPPLQDGTFYTSEIMATGYGIVALTLMITLPAFKCIRKRIPYGEQ